MFKRSLVFVFLLPLLVGCGQQALETKMEVVDENTIRDARLESFNTELGNINDKATAKSAFSTFANYVEGPASGAAASTARVFSDGLIDRLAYLEAVGREKLKNGGTSAMAGSSEGLTTLDQVTAALNVAKDQTIPEIKRDDVELIQGGIRSELPNVYVHPPIPSSEEATVSGFDTGDPNYRSDILTPMETVLIGYVVASGDDGGAAPGTYKDQLPQEKVSTFLENAIK